MRSNAINIMYCNSERVEAVKLTDQLVYRLCYYALYTVTGYGLCQLLPHKTELKVVSVIKLKLISVAIISVLISINIILIYLLIYYINLSNINICNLWKFYTDNSRKSSQLSKIVLQDRAYCLFSLTSPLEVHVFLAMQQECN